VQSSEKFEIGQLAEVMTCLACILEVPGLNLGWGVGYLDLGVFCFQASPGNSPSNI
jgi:hypothetical protein